MTIRIQDYPFMTPTENALAMDVGRSVVAGLAPFRAQQIELFTEYNIDFYEWLVWVDVRGNGWRLAHKESVPVGEMADHTEREILKLCKLFFKAFQQRETDPIPNNVVLGEN